MSVMANDNELTVERLRTAAQQLYDANLKYRDDDFWKVGPKLAEIALLLLDAADEIERLQRNDDGS